MGRLLIQFAGTNTTKALSETLSKNVIIVDEDLHQLRLHDGVTPGGHIIGGSGSSNIDDLTITKNINQEMQTVATVNANTATGATNPIYYWIGTAAEYTAQNIATLHPDWICFIIDKASPAVNHHVIEAQYPDASNGYTWYFKYSDGWVEQGGVQIGNGVYGKATVNLPVEMADNTYQAFGNIGWINESTWYTNSSTSAVMAAITDVTGATTDKTTTTFSIQSFSTHNWYACGMAA